MYKRCILSIISYIFAFHSSEEKISAVEIICFEIIKFISS